MPRYRVHRIRESAREHFRWAPHTGGLAIVKPRDYQPGEVVVSQSPYSLWKELLQSGNADGLPLRPGDLLETLNRDNVTGETADEAAHEATSGALPGPLLITKYIGFEPAQWFVPESKALEPEAAANQPPGGFPMESPQPEKALQS